MTIRRLLMPIACLAMLICTSMPFAQTRSGSGGASKTNNSDIELVEKLLIARRDYQRALELLHEHYDKSGDTERDHWAKDELRDYHRINHQAYRLDLDVPPPTLQATTNIPEANKEIARAKEYKDKGMGTDYIDNQRRAELLLQQVLTKYPTSNRIGEVAFLLGDLYESSAFKQYRRAAAYYERCFQWSPSAPFDSRIRAARLYDKKVQDRTRASEIYTEISTHETDPKIKTEADKRVRELKGGR